MTCAATLSIAWGSARQRLYVHRMTEICVGINTSSLVQTSRQFAATAYIGRENTTLQYRCDRTRRPAQSAGFGAGVNIRVRGLDRSRASIVPLVIVGGPFC
jgi:hypothetical protein